METIPFFPLSSGIFQEGDTKNMKDLGSNQRNESQSISENSLQILSNQDFMDGFRGAFCFSEIPIYIYIP